MLISRTSCISGETHTLELSITSEQLDRIENRFDSKELIQDIVPHLSIDEREFLMTVITSYDFKIIFGLYDFIFLINMHSLRILFFIVIPSLYKLC